VAAFAQSVPTSIAGITEPTELTGEPKKVAVATAAEKEFLGKALESFDRQDTATLKDALSKFVRQEPDYSDAYLMRAMTQCFLGGADSNSVLDDIAKAISTHTTSQRPASRFSTPETQCGPQTR
jgi:Tfp pilus assembly protein PilF